MASKSRATRRDVAVNRRRILDAAAALLLEDRDAQLADIADAAGIGRTTVYRHFRTREAILEALFEEITNQGEHVLQQVLLAAFASEEFSVVAVADQAIDLVFGLGDHFAIVYARDPAHRGMVVDHFARIAETAVAQGQRRGELSSAFSPRAIGLAAIGMTLDALRHATRDDVSRDDVVAVLKATMFAGVAAPPAPPA